jgi:hypothetical protein
LVRILSCQKNRAVSLQALSSLCNWIDIDFVPEDFAGSKLLAPTIENSIKLLHLIEEDDCLLQVLSSLTELIKGLYIVGFEYYPRILGALQVLWRRGTQLSGLARRNILKILTEMLQTVAYSESFHQAAFSSEKSAFFRAILQVIQYSTSLRCPESTYLLEEGLDLWYLLLTNLPDDSVLLRQLVPNLFVLISQCSEELHSSLRILAAYLVFCPVYFAQPETLERLVLLLSHQMLNAPEQFLPQLCDTSALLLRVIPCRSHSPSLFRSLLQAALKVVQQKIEEVSPLEKDSVESVYSLLATAVLSNHVASQQMVRLLGRPALEYWARIAVEVTDQDVLKRYALFFSTLLPHLPESPLPSLKNPICQVLLHALRTCAPSSSEQFASFPLLYQYPKKMIRGHHNHHMNNNSKDSLIYFSLFGNKFTPTNWDEYNRKPV